MILKSINFPNAVYRYTNPEFNRPILQKIRILSTVAKLAKPLMLKHKGIRFNRLFAETDRAIEMGAIPGTSKYVAYADYELN